MIITMNLVVIDAQKKANYQKFEAAVQAIPGLAAKED
jgi:hypothetical protein